MPPPAKVIAQRRLRADQHPIGSAAVTARRSGRSPRGQCGGGGSHGPVIGLRAGGLSSLCQIRMSTCGWPSSDSSSETIPRLLLRLEAAQLLVGPGARGLLALALLLLAAAALGRLLGRLAAHTQSRRHASPRCSRPRAGGWAESAPYGCIGRHMRPLKSLQRAWRLGERFRRGLERLCLLGLDLLHARVVLERSAGGGASATARYSAIAYWRQTSRPPATAARSRRCRRRSARTPASQAGSPAFDASQKPSRKPISPPSAFVRAIERCARGCADSRT